MDFQRGRHIKATYPRDSNVELIKSAPTTITTNSFTLMAQMQNTPYSQLADIGLPAFDFILQTTLMRFRRLFIS